MVGLLLHSRARHVGIVRFRCPRPRRVPPPALAWIIRELFSTTSGEEQLRGVATPHLAITHHANPDQEVAVKTEDVRATEIALTPYLSLILFSMPGDTKTKSKSLGRSMHIAQALTRACDQPD